MLGRDTVQPVVMEDLSVSEDIHGRTRSLIDKE